MYQPHSVCGLPEDPAAKVWRYMNVGKLIHTIDSGSLFFPRLAVLAGQDPYEGFLGEATEEWIRKSPSFSDENRDKIIRTHRNASNWLFVSCWHVNEYESAAMWNLYASYATEGVAIQTTVERLRNAFGRAEIDVHIGAVEYIDHRTTHVGWTNIYYPALRKRLSYRHEQELRAIVMAPEAQGLGIDVAVDVSELIERVVIAPTTPAWVGNLIGRVGARYGYQLAVESSPLLNPPV